jgi:proteasome accessory factor B
LGVPIEVGSFDPLFDDEPGYRILSSEFALPAIDLDAEEAAVVGVAARVWRHASMAESTRSAIAKLRAAGVEPDASQLASLEPSVRASEPGFDVLWNAVLERARVSFTYRDGNPRTLEPWGLTSFKGRWYVIGRDVDRAATRMFKLSRMTDLPKRLARSLAPREPTETAVLAIRTGKAPPLGRRGEPATSNVKLPAGFAVYAVGFSDLHSAAEEITQYGADVVVVEPAELRELVVRGLTAVAQSVTAA